MSYPLVFPSFATFKVAITFPFYNLDEKNILMAVIIHINDQIMLCCWSCHTGLVFVTSQNTIGLIIRFAIARDEVKNRKLIAFYLVFVKVPWTHTEKDNEFVRHGILY